ncbi:MAG: response regulator [Pirellulales bacterium]
MTKRVLDVGQCSPDHQTIRRYLSSNFNAAVDQTHGPEDTLQALRERSYDLVLINRKLDRDYSDGLEILRQIKSDPELASVPVMLVTNYAEHQDAAVAAGGERGFGKLEYDKPETREKLRALLG